LRRSTPKAFISSTSLDLEDYRKVAIETCLELGFQPIAMEYFEATSKGATEGSRKKLEKADLYIGILAHRYGFIEDGYTKSVTELEYEFANQLGIDQLCFVIDTEYPWPVHFVDIDKHSKLLEFKNRIDATKIRAKFTNVDNFRAKLIQALVGWRTEQPDFLTTSRSTEPFEDYLTQLQQEITTYLTKFVLLPIDLSSKPAHEKFTDPQQEDYSPELLQTFFGTSLPIRDKTSTCGEETEAFDSFVDAFQYYGGQVLVLGDPGAGKTTTLMTYALRATNLRISDPASPLPLIARIADWSTYGEPSVVKWMSQKNGLDYTALVNLRRQGRLLLLLDGLDELRPSEVQKQTGDLKTKFLDTLEKEIGSNQIIITSRSHDFSALNRKTRLRGAVTLAPLTDNQIRYYLSKHRHIWTLLATDNELLEIVRVPLFLSSLTFAFGSETDHKDKLAELRGLSEIPGKLRNSIIRRYVERRYEHETRKRGVDFPAIDDFYAFWGRIAVELMEATDRCDLESLVHLYGYKKMLQAAVELNIVVHDNYDLRFSHQILKTHFAASYWLDQYRDGTESLLKIRDSNAFNDEQIAALTDVKLMKSLLSGLGQTDRAKRLDNLIDFISFIQILREAVAISDQGKTDLAELQLNITRIATEYFTASLDDGDAIIRYYAILGLWHCLKESESMDPILSGLYDEDEEVRALSAEVAGDLLIKQAIEPISQLLNDPSDLVIESAQWALEKLKNKYADG
jgi:hypothetical protein